MITHIDDAEIARLIKFREDAQLIELIRSKVTVFGWMNALFYESRMYEAEGMGK